MKHPAPRKLVTLDIAGMSCSHCISTITKALRDVPDVSIRWVMIGRAMIEVASPDVVSDAVAVLQEAGYEAVVVDNASPGVCRSCGGSEGRHAASCASK